MPWSCTSVCTTSNMLYRAHEVSAACKTSPSVKGAGLCHCSDIAVCRDALHQVGQWHTRGKVVLKVS